MTASTTMGDSKTVTRQYSDFNFGKEIGVGSFSKVRVAVEISTGKDFAIKVVDKAHVLRNKAIDSVLMEKEVLKRTNHPFLTQMYCTFQNSSTLFFVLSYASRGELLTYLHKLTCFNVECTRFYSAEIFAGVEYLHSVNIVHRDVKPENVLLGEDMHIKLCDFGSAVILNAPEVKAQGFTGTPQYVSPEMLNFGGNRGSDVSDDVDKDTSDPTSLVYLMDFWSFGCVVYQLLAGELAFQSKGHEYQVFQKILGLEYTFPDTFNETAKDLVTKLLVLDPKARLGSPRLGGHAAIKRHPFFGNIDWDNLIEQHPPVLAPDTSSFISGFPAESSERVELSETLCLARDEAKQAALVQQEKSNNFHRFVRGQLIVKQGVLLRRRGLFYNKRVYLLTLGPHLFCVDMDKMAAKNEVLWTSSTSFELVSDKLFFVRSLSKSYYFETPVGDAKQWVDRLEEIKAMYATNSPC